MSNESNSICSLYAQTEENVIKSLKDRGLYFYYTNMNEHWKQQFMDFCTGKITLPLLYDTTFKRIFHPNVHSDRLSDFISSIIGDNVTVKEVYPCEDSFIEGGTMVIMDIIVELSDGSIADVEIQKAPYNFAGERISCYSSDLLLRQYSKIRGVKGKKFKYCDLRKVYTIVIYEKTTAPFHNRNNHYIHHGKTSFDSGLQLEMLQNCYLIALDVFRKKEYYDDSSRLAGWLSLLVIHSADDINAVITRHPWLEDIYREILRYRCNPAEVFEMYSDMLRELDHNSMQYLIDEQKEQIELLIMDNQKKDVAILEKDNAILEKDKEIMRLKELLKQ